MQIPKNDYPRPTLVRDQWINLNGKWQFEMDHAKVGTEKEFYKRKTLRGEILVPFCPESRLSGIGCTDFINCVWYKRTFSAKKESGRTILHFGAVDYFARVYLNGVFVGSHKGGYTPFCFDITDFLKDGENELCVCAEDDVRSGTQPIGKQSVELYSKGGCYTRTTGIWQTVWMENVPECHVRDLKITTNISVPSMQLQVELSEMPKHTWIVAEAFWQGTSVGTTQVEVFEKQPIFSMELSEKHLWKVGEGGLYDLKLRVVCEGETVDTVQSYFGLRSVSMDGRNLKINGETVFGRWVLDQGFYPDGIYTAPTDADLKNDIIYAMQLGFNGARMHQKIFEPRYLYWADVLGYTVWGEYANVGLDITVTGQNDAFLQEWIEAVKRDYNHPSLIGWCPFNETVDFHGKRQDDEILRTVYRVTKMLDPNRPVIDTSGFYHVETDIFDVHNYNQDPDVFRADFAEFENGTFIDYHEDGGRQKYDGVSPMFVSEYGGIQWSNDQNSWGYGEAPKSEQEFIERYRGLTDILLDNPYMMGFCYTQLYDIEQEQNGLMTYDRRFKFDPEIFRKINARQAAIEKE